MLVGQVRQLLSVLIRGGDMKVVSLRLKLQYPKCIAFQIKLSAEWNTKRLRQVLPVFCQMKSLLSAAAPAVAAGLPVILT